MRLKPVQHRKILALLKEAGYEPVRQKGSHLILRNKEGKLIVVPIHLKDLGVGLVREIIRELGMTREEFLEALEKM